MTNWKEINPIHSIVKECELFVCLFVFMFETAQALNTNETFLFHRWAKLERQRYFTPAEVAAHNTAADLWVSFLGRVCDLTPLMNQFKGQGVSCV